MAATKKPAPPPRLIDLRIDWLAQYAPEIALFGAEVRLRAARDVGRVDGYFGATSVAVIGLGHDATDWATHPDRWKALGDLISRAEAEFPGRLLLGRSDLSRWRNDPKGLTWGILAISGFDALIRTSDDLSHLQSIFRRGVRVFQPTTVAANSWFVHENGLTELGQEFLDTLQELGRDEKGPKPTLDVAGLNHEGLQSVLQWYEAEPERASRLVPMRSSGPIDEAAIKQLRRIQELGGLIGMGISTGSFSAVPNLKAAVDALDSGAIGLATNAFASEPAMGGLESMESIREWAVRALGPERAAAFLRTHSERWITRIVGE